MASIFSRLLWDCASGTTVATNNADASAPAMQTVKLLRGVFMVATSSFGSVRPRPEPRSSRSRYQKTPTARTLREVRSATRRATAIGPRLLVDRHQPCRAAAQFADPGARVRVRGQPFRGPAAARLDHVLPQVHGRARIEAGARHQLLADHVGLGLLGTRARQQEPGLGEDASALHRGVGDAAAVARAQQAAEQLDHAGRAGLAGDALVVVVGEYVADLVRHDRGQLVLVGGDLEQAGVYADLAAGQHEGIGVVV